MFLDSGTAVHNQAGDLIGRIRPVELTERAVGAVSITYTSAWAADIKTSSGNWTQPTKPYYATPDEARHAIETAHATPTPQIPKGLRLGSHQKHALWIAVAHNVPIDDKHGPALAKKGLAEERSWLYWPSGLGRQVAHALFDDDGNPR